ncbi:hypothetical protein [Aureicoccus marinus]|uniref:Uncharacterized protein n=1 Tax=Aureicoccus marinus TaxID=754435 RepID=A0A2S7T658_9FLAO|nr:hypothetical protein [Aureicoccus marinus]PQJ15412.1 hypothetical protein BST99_06400 [Aureicoccus marinus]
MQNSSPSIKTISLAFFSLIALIILADYALPGSSKTSEVQEVQKHRQNYYNAAQGYHYSYRVITPEQSISVAENFAKLIHDEPQIEYSVSPIFGQVNWYSLPSDSQHYTYSLRIVSGLAFPLAFLALVFFSYRLGKKWSFPLLVARILMIANLWLVIGS